MAEVSEPTQRYRPRFSRKLNLKHRSRRREPPHTSTPSAAINPMDMCSSYPYSSFQPLWIDIDNYRHECTSKLTLLSKLGVRTRLAKHP